MMTVDIPVRFRSMTLGDIPVVVQLERAVYPQPWSEGIFVDELSRQDRVYVVAEHESDIVGYGGLMLVREDSHVTTLAVRPGDRKAGLGTRLMLRLVAAALDRGSRNLTLEVRASNVGAQHLYKRFGMVPVGLRKHYYRDDDAVIMWAMDIDQPEYARRLATIHASLEETL